MPEDPDTPTRNPTARRVAIAVVATILASILLVAGGIAWAVATGAIATDLVVTGEVDVSGQLPISFVVGVLAGGIAVLVYTSLSALFGAERVEDATEAVTEATEGE